MEALTEISYVIAMSKGAQDVVKEMLNEEEETTSDSEDKNDNNCATCDSNDIASWSDISEECSD